MGIMDTFFEPQTQPSSAPAEGTTPPNTPPAKDNLTQNPPAVGPVVKMPGTDPNNQNPLDVYFVKCLIVIKQTYRHPPLRLILRF